MSRRNESNGDLAIRRMCFKHKDKSIYKSVGLKKVYQLNT